MNILDAIRLAKKTGRPITHHKMGYSLEVNDHFETMTFTGKEILRDDWGIVGVPDLLSGKRLIYLKSYF